MTDTTVLTEPQGKFWRKELQTDARLIPYPDQADDRGKRIPVSTAALKLVLSTLMRWCAPDGTMKYTTARATLVDYTGLSESTVDRATLWLSRAGYVTKVEIGGGGVRKTHYRVEVTRIRALAAPERERRQKTRRPAATPPSWVRKPPTMGQQKTQRGEARSAKRRHDSSTRSSLRNPAAPQPNAAPTDAARLVENAALGVTGDVLRGPQLAKDILARLGHYDPAKRHPAWLERTGRPLAPARDNGLGASGGDERSSATNGTQHATDSPAEKQRR